MNDVAELLSGTVQLDIGVVVTMTGEIDMSTAPCFRALVDEAITVGTGTVTVDLAGVTFVSSPGLTVLADAGRRLDDSGRSLVVRASSAPVRRLLAITHLTELLGSDVPPPPPSRVDLIPQARAGGATSGPRARRQRQAAPTAGPSPLPERLSPA